MSPYERGETAEREGVPRLPRADKAPRERLVGLDGIRGLCALGVMAYHYCWYGNIAKFYTLGTYGVYTFFALSGFVLFYGYAQEPVSGDLLRRFFLARFWRLFPLYALFVTLSFISSRDVTSYLLNASFLFSLTNPGVSSSIGLGWSIGIEVVFYLLFPAILIFRSTKNLVIAFLGSLLVSGFYVHRVFHAYSGDDNLTWLHHIQAVSFLPFFLAGVLGARIFETRKIKSPVTYLGSVALLLIVMFWSDIFGMSRSQAVFGISMPILVVLSGSLVYIGACADPGRIVAAVSRFLGDISYCLYLSHFFVWRHLESVLPNPVVRGVVSAIITIAMSKVIYDFFERPLRQYGARLRDRGRETGAVT